MCSNGKAILQNADSTLTLFDIDSCTKKIVKRILDVKCGVLGAAETIIDLTSENVFPDGMILTPDHRSLIVALYDPGDPKFGVARQFNLKDGSLETVWTCMGSPRVTCPQLIEHNGKVRLLLTTAVEHMTPEQQVKHPNAGCLFIGDTAFETLGDQPIFHIKL